MIYRERNKLHLFLRDGEMSRTVMPPQNYILRKVYRIRFGKRASGTQQGHDFHSLHILYLTLTGHGNASSRQQGIASYYGSHQILIAVAGETFIIIGKGAKPVSLNQLVQCNRGTCGPLQFVLLTLRTYIKLFMEFIQFGLKFILRRTLVIMCQLTHLYLFDIGAKDSRLQRDIRIHIQHAGIVMPQNAHPVLTHTFHNPYRIKPVLDYLPHGLVR